jgi:hypothetical protein
MPSLGTVLTTMSWYLLILVHAKVVSGSEKFIVELYSADRTTLFGPMLNDMNIDVSATPRLNIKASVPSTGRFGAVASVSLFIDNQLIKVDNANPAWLSRLEDVVWTPKVGTHTVTAQAHRRMHGQGRVMQQTSVRLTVLESQAPTSTPLAAPRGGPMMPPIVAPVATPMKESTVAPIVTPVVAPASVPMASAPVMAPIASPMVAPANVPMASAPIMAPIVTPMAAPASVPMASTPIMAPVLVPKLVTPTNRPTKHPTWSPTKIPITAAPTPCVSDIVKLINSITLSGQTLSLNGTTLLDQALQQLVELQAQVSLSTCVGRDRERLRQRWAYLAFIFSTGKGQETRWFSSPKECAWRGIGCCSNNRVVGLDLTAQDLRGSIPAEVGLWSNMASFVASLNQLNGTLPFTMERWTDLTKFCVSDNALKGSLPAGISHWAGLMYFGVNTNLLTGTLPVSIGAWTDLDMFFVHNNYLNGTLPAAALAQWSVLNSFEVTRNKLSGTLPVAIGKWTLLSSFGISDNQFTGTVPAEVSQWKSIFSAHFRNNKLSGSMPVIGNSFCPRFDSSGFLLADCKAPATFACECCNLCCDGSGNGNCVYLT